jgi:hypothetical protein
MRLVKGGVAHLACVIEDDLASRNTGLHKPHIKALSDLASCVLACRHVNTSEWIAILPRKTKDDKSKERFISRFLSNKLIDLISVMEGFIPEMVAMMSTSPKQLY